MSSDSNTMENTFQDAGDDVRTSLSDIASTIRAEAEDVKDSVYSTMEQCEFAAETLSKTAKKVADLTRRYPLQIIAAALALGFLIRRSRG